MNTTEFITLCDSTPAGVRTAGAHGNAYQEEVVRIKNALTPADNSGVPFNEFKKLRTGFIYLSIIDDSKDYSPYYYILEKISGHFNGSTSRIADWNSQVWKDVIAYAKSLPEYPRTNDYLNGLTRVEERERAKAAVRLKVYGAIPKVTDCKLEIENKEVISNKIEQLLVEIGGINALHKLLEYLPFMKEIGRFLVPHGGNRPMTSMVETEMPYGYLFYLSLKHIKDAGVACDINKRWKELNDICKDYCLAEYDVMKFDIWKYIVFQREDLIRIVHDLVLMFDLYTLPQTSASFSLDWCKYLCKQVMRDQRCDATLETKIKSLMKCMQWAANASSNEKCVVVRKGRPECRTLEDNKGLIVNKIIIKADQVNVAFVNPDDFDKVNSVCYPIIESEDDYVLLPKPLVVWNWCEAILNIVKPYKDLTKDIGLVMENYMSNKMSTHGITCHDGKYKYHDGEGEEVEGQVDFLIQAIEGDGIIESKKKSFTLPARSGDDIRIWGDLYDVIYSQMQCVRLENGVKKHGAILLNGGRDTENFNYQWVDNYDHIDEDGSFTKKPRKVVKATMTLKEYGPMQDKIVLSSILKNLIGVDLTYNIDPADQKYSLDDQKRIKKTFDNINAALKDMTAYYQEIGDRNPTFFCRFFSMEQLYFLIKQASGNEDFYKLIEGGFASTGTLNFWNEYLNLKMITSAGA